MRSSNMFFITRKEMPHDESSIFNQLLVRSGMVFKHDDGCYSYLPIGKRVYDNVVNIIKSEFERVKAEEVLIPNLVSSDMFSGTKRKEIINGELFTFLDRSNHELCLCPSSEELFACVASRKIQSYKDLHFMLYQCGSKYRNEVRNEYGLVRKKEFSLIDAYSFDANDGGLDVSYDKMFQAFKRSFERMGLHSTVVDVTMESEHELSSEEFQVIDECGDNEIVKCKSCSFTMNRDIAPSYGTSSQSEEKMEKLTLVDTPNVKSIEEVAEFLDVKYDRHIKSLVIKVDDELKMILLKGTSEVSFAKLEKYFNTSNIEFANEEDLNDVDLVAGFIGPIDTVLEVIADNEVKSMQNAVCGGNRKDKHYINACIGRDFKVSQFADLKRFDENSVCPRCKSKCEILHGIEVGQITKIGDYYSKEYNLKYSNEVNEVDYVHMGGYGIGIDRCIAALVAQNHDDKGIIWPINVAPFKVVIVVANLNHNEAYKYAISLSEKLESIGISTLVDDRKESIGSKFADMDLIGIPIRVVVGMRYSVGEVEFKLREQEKGENVKKEEIVERIVSEIESRTFEYKN